MSSDEMSSQFMLPDPTDDQDDPVLRQFIRLIDFTPEELFMNKRGDISDRQMKGLIRSGKYVGVLIMGFSSLLVLCYIGLMILLLTESELGAYSFIYIFGLVIYAGAAGVSIPLIRTHMNPQVQTARGPLEIRGGTKSFSVQGMWFTVHGEEKLQSARAKTDQRYVVYYFKSLMGTKVLSIEPQEG